MRHSLSLVLLLTACVATASCGCRLEKDGLLKMGRKVETELPLGSTQAEVEKFLDDMRIEPGGHIKLMDTAKYDKLQQIVGSVDSSEPEGDLVFFFRDGKLVEWWVSSDCGGGCYFMRGNTSSYRESGVHQCYDP